MAQKIYTPATKSMNPWDVDDNRGWDILGGNKDTPEKELVPTVADCVDELGKGLASVPFSIYNEKGDKVDDGDDYKNVTSLLPDPYAFFWLTGTSLVLSGQAYWGKKNNTFGFSKGLRYWAFPNVRPNITTGTTKENLTFEYDGKKIPAKDVLYMWLPDPRVEFGPPSNYPMKRAEKSAGAVSAISEFVNNYMNSGMVKAFIASSESMPKDQEEKAQMEDYLTRILTGVRKAVMRIRVISKNLTFTLVGGGLDELRNVGVIKEIKQDILEAFGVPASRVWGNAANYATAANDTIVFITSEVMPLALVVQAAVNEQVFAPFGYKLVFEPRRMEEFAVVTAEKIKILQPVTETLSKVLSPAEALKAAVDITGIDLSSDVMEQIEAQILEEKKAKEKPAPPVVVTTDAPAPQYQEPTVTEPPDAGTTKALVELDKWQTKSEKAGVLVTWHAVALPVEIVDAVKAGTTWQEAREMLTGKIKTGEAVDEWVARVHPGVIEANVTIKTLAASINALADAMKK